MESNKYHFDYKATAFEFPLYSYNQVLTEVSFTECERGISNLKSAVIDEFTKSIELRFVPEKEAELNVCFANSSEIRPEYRDTFSPIDILDYIYALIHSRTYRETCKEFLKIDFPKVPFPKDAATFWKLVKLGGEIRQIHLLESDVVEKHIAQYPALGDTIMDKFKFVIITFAELLEVIPGKEVFGKVYINDLQYFDDVPERAWEFHIGDYLPAQVWLKNRKGRELSFEDILHYQKIIIALTETERIMKEIDEIAIC